MIKKIFYSVLTLSALALFLFLPSLVSLFVKEKSLTIFTWPLMIDPIYVKQFEKDTGIKLYIVYYDSSAALLNKLQASEGKGYDLIIADDHTIELIREQGLLKKIDGAQLGFLKSLNPSLFNNYYDPSNEYTIPLYWAFYGVGYNTNHFGKAIDPSWALLFDAKLAPGKVCMTDDPREAIMIAAQYLYGTIDQLADPHVQEKITQMLIEQKKRVEVYSIARSDNLLQTDSCKAAAITSPDVKRLQKDHKNIEFLMPKEGGFLIIDAFVIPKSTGKDAMIYQFLNYFYGKEALTHHINLYGYCSPIYDLNNPATVCSDSLSKKPDFFRNILSDRQLNELWVRVLAS